MKNKLINIKKEVFKQLNTIKNIAKDVSISPEDVKNNLQELEIKYLSRKGEFTQLLRVLKDLSTETRKEVGVLANEVKKELQDGFNEIKNFINTNSEEEFIDVTLPGKKIATGHLHPITQIQKELEDLFSSMGFMILDGPELESDYYNFEALNIAKNHPAREMQDTFYVKNSPNNYFQKKNPDEINNKKELDMVMRTHTSPVQIRAMQEYGAPIKAVSPGRVFRCEATDACHEHTFYQMEGLMIDENISITNLISVMQELINNIFDKKMQTRVRPGYFPFVEPGIEMDIKCTICDGKGCPSCKNSGWLEILPAGMVHPNVLKHGNINSQKFSGFAFGLGLTRLAMMKYGINNIRLFQSGDLRFLEQF